jgi:hypothetical protein
LLAIWRRSMNDPNATQTLDLPWELCSPKPDGTHHHEHDTIDLRTQYVYADTLQLAGVHMNGHIDPSSERYELLKIGIRGWSILDSDGEPLDVGPATILMLPPTAGSWIAERIDEFYVKSDVILPNPSSGQSPPSSPASLTASPNRATRRARRSTSKR